MRLGPIPVAVDAACSLSFGSLELTVTRRRREWRLEYGRGDVSEPVLERFAFRSTQDDLAILPTLADRHVVMRPHETIRIVPGEAALIYTSTVLWIRVVAGVKMLLELPSEVLSDTWFGSPAGVGELCYAGRTSARMSVEEIPVRTARVVTPVTLVNDGDDMLVVERLALPVTGLSIYRDETGALWTQAVTIVREQAGDTGRVDAPDAAPDVAHRLEKVGEPRERSSTGTLVRALNRLLG